MDLIPTLMQYKWVIIFYALLFLIIYLNRKKFEFQGKIIAVYRTKLGIALMEKLGKKYGELIKILGYIAIGVGFLGMFVILFMIGFSLYLFFNGLITTGQAPVTLAPVVPGIPIPDSPLQLPLIEGFLSIFIVVVIHEGSHGIVAVANRLKIKNTGYIQFGPIAGAFVEPDEKTLTKQSDVVQYSIFAAGPFSNILTAIVALLLFSFVMAPITNSMTEPNGFTFIGIQADQPAAHAGLKPGVVYNTVNNKTITNNADFVRMIQCAVPGTIFYIANENYTYKLVSIPNPNEPERAYLGISCYSSSDSIKCVDTAYSKKPSVNSIKYAIVTWFADVLKLVYILSLGVGLINLLPLGPVDGGRMFQLSAVRIFGKDKGTSIWGKISIILLIILLVLLLPVLKSILVAIIGLFG
jgi:membrane-associated protease RseP (regulator of RpoE activity)